MPTRTKKVPAKKMAKGRAKSVRRKRPKPLEKVAPAAKGPRARAPSVTKATSRADALAAAARVPAETARLILDHGRIALATVHSSGVLDDADAKQNMVDTAAGKPAKRSTYEGAPGGTIPLQPSVLDGMLALADDFQFRVSEVAGGSHSANSRHYVGVAFDIDRLQGSAVNAGNPHVPAVKQKLSELGATEVLGPGDPGHATHVHGAWPRP